MPIILAALKNHSIAGKLELIELLRRAIELSTKQKYGLALMATRTN